jgi:hypothetical protein
MNRTFAILLGLVLITSASGCCCDWCNCCNWCSRPCAPACAPGCAPTSTYVAPSSYLTPGTAPVVGFAPTTYYAPATAAVVPVESLPTY